MNFLRLICCVIALMAGMVLAGAAQSNYVPLVKNVRGVDAFLSTDLPSRFLDVYLCEHDQLAPSNGHSCVIMRKGGTGEWQNDWANFSNNLPPTPIKWYVVCDKTGKLLIESMPGMPEVEQFVIVFEYTQNYYHNKPGDFLVMTGYIHNKFKKIMVGSNKTRPFE